jgi:hypothetical protein
MITKITGSHRIAPLVAAVWCTLYPIGAQAYVGPGAGLTALGTMVALLAALLLAIVGFVWYPLKRLINKRKARPTIARDR